MARAAAQAGWLYRYQGGGKPRQEHPISGREAAPVIDQHAWLDPKNGVLYVRNIAQALERSDPANADDYRARAAAYIKQLQAVDA